jgi:hypothetical protein
MRKRGVLIHYVHHHITNGLHMHVDQQQRAGGRRFWRSDRRFENPMYAVPCCVWHRQRQAGSGFSLIECLYILNFAGVEGVFSV